MATIKELLGEAYKDGMSFEEIETALAGKKLADLSSGDYVSKGKLTDSERQAKELERKLAEKMTEEEKNAVALAEREERYKQIERENATIKLRAKLASTITDEKVLNKVAELYADGDVMEAVEKQNAYYATAKTELEKQIKAELLAKNPQPPADDGNDPKDYKYYMSSEKGMIELNKLQEANPQEYARILSGIGKT